MSESIKMGVFRAFCFQMHQSIKEILFDAVEARKKIKFFSPWMEEIWSQDIKKENIRVTLRKDSVHGRPAEYMTV